MTCQAISVMIFSDISSTTRRAMRSTCSSVRSEELAAGLPEDAREERAAVYGSTDDEPERHFLGWVGDVDPDELFDSGAAYGITVVRQAAGKR